MESYNKCEQVLICPQVTSDGRSAGGQPIEHSKIQRFFWVSSRVYYSLRLVTYGRSRTFVDLQRVAAKDFGSDANDRSGQRARGSSSVFSYSLHVHTFSSVSDEPTCRLENTLTQCGLDGCRRERVRGGFVCFTRSLNLR